MRVVGGQDGAHPIERLADRLLHVAQLHPGGSAPNLAQKRAAPGGAADVLEQPAAGQLARDHGPLLAVTEAQRAKLIARIRAVEFRHGQIDQLLASGGRQGPVRVIGQGVGQMDLENGPPAAQVGPANVDLEVAATLVESSVEQILPVGGTDDGHVLPIGKTIHLRQQSREKFVRMMRYRPATNASDALDFIEESHRETVLAGFA